MSKAKVQREVESIKQKMVCKNTVRWGSFTEEEMQVLHEAGEILERLRNEGKVKPHPTNSELVDISTSDEEHELLSKTVQILEAIT